jgi:hypothetical protein
MREDVPDRDAGFLLIAAKLWQIGRDAIIKLQSALFYELHDGSGGRHNLCERCQIVERARRCRDGPVLLVGLIGSLTIGSTVYGLAAPSYPESSSGKGVFLKPSFHHYINLCQNFS